MAGNFVLELVHVPLRGASEIKKHVDYNTEEQGYWRILLGMKHVRVLWRLDENIFVVSISGENEVANGVVVGGSAVFDVHQFLVDVEVGVDGGV